MNTQSINSEQVLYQNIPMLDKDFDVFEPTQELYTHLRLLDTANFYNNTSESEG